MLKRIPVLIVVLMLAGCASIQPPIGPRLPTSYGPIAQAEPEPSEVIMACLAGLAVDIAIGRDLTEDDVELPLAEFICESALH